MLRSSLIAVIAAVILFPQIALSQQRALTIAVVADGPVKQEELPIRILEKEITELLGTDYRVTLPEAKRSDGGWTFNGARDALRTALRDPNVDIILATGVLSGMAAARETSLAKPVIAPVVADPKLQGYPLAEDSSGKRNFVYVSNHAGVAGELQAFHDLVGFEQLAVLVDAAWIESLPALGEVTDSMEKSLGATISIVPVTDSATAAVAAIPASTDAVYVTPLLRFDTAESQRLAEGLIERKLPSFSSLGRTQLENGLMASTAGNTGDLETIARRVAVLTQRILRGADAGTLPVGFQTQGRLMLNLRTAKAIGFSPSWAMLADADILHREDEGGEQLSLVAALERSLEANLDLRTSEYDVRLSRDDTRVARGPLLPQLATAVSARKIDSDRAEPGFAERSTDGEIVGSQLIYSDQAHAEYRISRLLERAAGANHQAAALDTLQSTSTNYLALLQARALEAVQRSNVEVTRSHLELARVRERTGYSGRAEVLRWESQIATDRQNLIAAEAEREQRETELNRVLNRDIDRRITPTETETTRVLKLLGSKRVQRYLNNALDWETFQSFYRREALDNAPEISSLESQVSAQERQVLADKRVFYVPDVSLEARAGNNFSSNGAGSDLTGTGLDDQDWSIGVRASLPLFSGGALRARLSRSRNALRQFENAHAATTERVEARMRATLQQVSGSYPAIELSREAARAAKDNLDLVTDQYSKGVVSVTDLIDAQDAALAADLAAAAARFAFLIDFVEVLRAAGDFDLLLTEEAAESWLNRLDTFYTRGK